MSDFGGLEEGSDYATPDNPGKTKPLLLGQMGSNLSTNFNRMTNNFSQGNILHGIGDLYSLDKNPTGNLGSQANTYYPLPAFDKDKHLGSANENGVMPLNKDGQQLLQDHTGSLASQVASMGQSQPLPMPQSSSNMGGAQDESQGQIPNANKGIIGRSADQYTGGMLSEFI